MSHYLYRLRLIRPELISEGFSEAQLATMSRHRNHIADLTESGTILLAGRTDAEEATFGIVVFKAADSDEAQRIMLADPAVSEELMSSELFPFMLAFMGKGG